MSLNREQGLCVGVFVVCGALVASWWSNAYKPVIVPRSKKLAIPAAPAVNDVQIPRADEGRFDPLDRDFFVPPRDWNPLQPLALELHPLPPIPAVGPLLFPGPAPANSRSERQPAILPAVVDALAKLAGADIPIDGEAGSTSGAEGGDPKGTTSGSGGGSGGGTESVPNGAGNGGAGSQPTSTAAAQAPAPAKPAPQASPKDLSVAKDDPKTGKPVVDDQAAARRFDWISYKGEKRWYGRILNKDRTALIDDTTIPIDFEQVDPITGKSFGRNSIPRDRLTNGGEHRFGFDFANTAANRVLLRKYAALKEKSSATGFLAAARDCLSWRDEDAKAALAGANELIDRALAIDAGNVDAWVAKAEIRELAYDTEGEFKVLDEAKDKGVDDARLKARRARLFRKLGLLESASTLLEGAIQQNSLDASSLREYGQLKLAQGDAAGAQQAFDNASRLQVSPEMRQQLRVDYARALLYGGDIAGAFQSIDPLVKGGMATADAWVLRGVCQFLQGARDKAQSDLKSAIDIDPRNRDAVYDLGVLLGLSGDVKGAMARFAEADELDPLRGFDTECARGILMELGGNLERASTYFEHALQLHPDNPFGTYRMGRLARRNENHEIAAASLAKALLEIGDMIDVLNELGYVALQADIFEDAEKYFSESLRREPDQIPIRVLLAASLVRQNRIAEAKREYEAAAVNSDPTALCGVAFCAYREGDVEQALDKFAAAKGAAKSDAPAGAQIDPKADPKAAPAPGSASEVYLYAETLQKRIDDHRMKEQWVDDFERDQIKNDWNVIESAGPTCAIEKGVVQIKGTQRPGEDSFSEIARPAEGGRHILYESEMRAGPQNGGFYGVRVVLEKGRGNSGSGGNRVDEPFAEIAVAIFPDKTVRIFLRDQDFSQISQNWTEALKLPADFDFTAFHKLTIERTDWEKATFVVRIDEKTLDLPGKTAEEPRKSSFVVPGLRKVKSNLKVSTFAAGKARENVDVEVTTVRVVRYKGT